MRQDGKIHRVKYRGNGFCSIAKRHSPLVAAFPYLYPCLLPTEVILLAHGLIELHGYPFMPCFILDGACVLILHGNFEFLLEMSRSLAQIMSKSGCLGDECGGS
ncbi:MAG: hypothetical protein B7Z80_06390 [Rhodospirillales bacterium 20-64-7]|nr:MAG: hypothetical protein B7Z80_06390 [Rhodospirillales bacterium 20-64-7]